MIKANLSTIIKIKNELIDKISGSFIANITIVNNSDLFFSFSHYKEEKLLVSLNISSVP